MSKKNTFALYIFRRDIRLSDNHGLNQALKNAEHVIPCFIFDPRQVGSNEYKSDNALAFMINSLKELRDDLKAKKGRLYFFYGEPDTVVKNIRAKLAIDAVYVTADYTPFSQQRDALIQKVCAKHDIAWHSIESNLMFAPGSVVKKDGTPYTIFTPFYKKALALDVLPPQRLSTGSFYTKPIAGSSSSIPSDVSYTTNKNIALKGGRAEGKKILKNIASLSDYLAIRDFPELETSKLSAHHKFGTVSIRESYYAIADHLGVEHPLLRQLYWRDFFTHIAFFFPHIFKTAFHKKYAAISWSRSQKNFMAWCNGTTGFPIVDAGMRELNTTGYMHNRVRMITASFLVKDLHINWQWGEKYFAQKLVDYDPSVNNGNWQWAASTGCDATPYFRIFNPWTQQKKFDPEATYIKRWIPELKKLSAREIHGLEKNNLKVPSYPEPMVDHGIERIKTLEMFKKARV